MNVEEEKKRVDLEPAAGGSPPKFGGTGAAIHGRVRQKMREVYMAENVPAFLDPQAVDLLKEARHHFRAQGMRDHHVLKWGQNAVILPWSGDIELNTLLMMLKGRGFTASMEPPAIVVDDVSVSDLRIALADMAADGPPDPYDLAASVENKQSEKHHRFLGEDLLGADYASKSLDPEGAARVLDRIIG